MKFILLTWKGFKLIITKKKFTWKSNSYNTVTGSSSQKHRDTGLSVTAFKSSLSTSGLVMVTISLIFCFHICEMGRITSWSRQRISTLPGIPSSGLRVSHHYFYFTMICVSENTHVYVYWRYICVLNGEVLRSMPSISLLWIPLQREAE